jgi:hypothetical protein
VTDHVIVAVIAHVIVIVIAPVIVAVRGRARDRT